MAEPQEIVYDGKRRNNKIEIWKYPEGFRLRIFIQDPIYGSIEMVSEFFDHILAADSRAVIIAKRLNLERDNLPVHVRKT